MKLRKSAIKTNITNTFGAFGYLSCAMQWLWVIMLYSSLIKVLAQFFIDNGTTQNSVISPVTTSAASGSSPNIIFVIITVIIVVIFIALAAYMIVKIPTSIVKTTKNVVHQTAENVTPVVLCVKNKKDTKKRHKKLSYWLVFTIKIVLIILPIILGFLSNLLSDKIFDFNMSIIISFWLAAVSAIFFTIQYVLIEVLSINKGDVW